MKKVAKKITLLLIVIGIGVCLTLLYTNNKYKVYDEGEPKQIKKHVDTISMMLETEAGSGNYEMTTSDSWPTESYIFNSELSKCENGGKLSWDDTNKKILMSGNVSDKCYVYFDKAKVISFVLEGTEFQAEENMNMAQWINSDYNIYGYYFEESCSSTYKSSCMENTQQNIVKNGTYYINSFFFGYGVIGSGPVIDRSKVTMDNILVDAANEPAKSLQFSSLSYQSYYGPTEIISESYSIIKGDLSPITDLNLADYVFDFDAPFVLSNPEYEKGHNFEVLSITFECAFITNKNEMKGVKILHYSNKSGQWEVLSPRKLDFDSKIITMDFSEISLGDPILIIHK